MLYYKDLENVILHSDIAKKSDKLFVISGYVGSEIINDLSKLPNNIQFDIVYGMYGNDFISEPLHKRLVELNKKYTNINIRYSTVPVHSKIYCWFLREKVSGGLIGSANFTINGLRKDFKETLADIQMENIDDYQRYFQYVIDNSIPCTDSKVIFKKAVYKPRKIEKGASQPFISEGICRLSLLDRNNLVPKKSGLNWGCSKGHVSVGDAYIKITADYIKQFPSLFPQKKYVDGTVNTESKGKPNRENDEVELIWDDGVSMVGLMEGQIKVDGVLYPKQLTSSARKNELGKYLRKRLGNLPIDYVIKKKDLTNYGRTNIDISLIGDGIYYLDFSVNKRNHNNYGNK
mgnify:CR=1 FL=1